MTENSNYPLMGTRFVLDEERIKQDGKYNLDQMYEKIDVAAKSCNMQKHDKNTYYAVKGINSLSDLGSFVYTQLIRCDWFVKYVKEWEWLDEEDGNETLMNDIKAV